MAYSLGIDLGTTYSAAATARDGRIEIFQLGERAATIPSIVVLRADGEVLVGDTAERRSLTEPTRTAREFKRRLGDPTPIILGGTPYGAESLLAHLLKAIVVKVSEQSGGPPDAIALTHPASYGAYKIDLLEQAVRQADVDNVTLLTEPEAAAVHYAQQERVPAGAVIAVYDFGGGTFDATILRKAEDGFEQLGRPEGMERLGGIDFDEAMFTSVMAQVRAAGVAVDPNDPAALAAIARLREECRRAKEALSSDTDTAIQVVLPGLQTEMRLTREEFEEMIRPRITETIGALGRAAKSAGFGFDGVDRILLVGGSSRIPLVAEMVREATGRPIAVDAHPKHSMALGAAFVAEQRRLGAVADAEDDVGLAEAAVVAAAGAGTILAIEDAAAMDPAAGGAAAGSDAAGVAAGAAAAGAATSVTGADAPTEAVPVAPVVPAAVAAVSASDGGPPTSGTPGGTTATGGADRRPLIAAIAALGAVALVLLLAIGASGMLSGVASSSPPASVAAVSTSSVAPSLAPTPSPTAIPSATAQPTPTAVPTPTPTPAGRQARIAEIAITNDRYVVEYDVFGYAPALPGRHVHFFFDTVSVADAGVPGQGPWFLYAGPAPFTGYKLSDRPAAADQMCILVANPDHSIVPDTGNCIALP